MVPAFELALQFECPEGSDALVDFCNMPAETCHCEVSSGCAFGVMCVTVAHCVSSD